MGGTLEIESKPGEGTRVICELPPADTNLKPHMDSTETSGTRLRKKAGVFGR